jgi:4-hydroxybenzoate polyprenyltransferase
VAKSLSKKSAPKGHDSCARANFAKRADDKLRTVIRRLVGISRPVLWINTIGTTVVAMWVSGFLWSWEMIPILLWVTLPFNLLIYGINDIFDQETDAENERKGGYGGARIKPTEVGLISWAAVLLNLPFLVYFAVTVPLAAFAWMLAYMFLFWQYSARPLRFKARPIWDSVSNAAYAFPLAFVPLALGVEPSWFAVVGLMTWSMAKHVYDSIQDIDEDASAGISTTAVTFGIRGSLVWSGSWWIVSTIAFALVNVPVAIVSAAISGWLLFANWRTPTIAEAKRLYKYSVSFPYVAGAVAGVQLVAGMLLGLYP